MKRREAKLRPEVVISASLRSADGAGAEIAIVEITGVELGSISVVVFGDIDRAITIDAFYPKDVTIHASTGLTDRVSDWYTNANIGAVG